MERQEGYYWVKKNKNGSIQPAFYVSTIDAWDIANVVYNEKDIFWIDLPENRLTPPNI
nr:hypothetical protein [uncultured Flavobacterium sp.]